MSFDLSFYGWERLLSGERQKPYYAPLMLSLIHI